jgi:hypothetical protein
MATPFLDYCRQHFGDSSISRTSPPGNYDAWLARNLPGFSPTYDVLGYPFEGPFTLAEVLARFSGVPGIYLPVDQLTHCDRVLDVGESEDIAARLRHHDRALQWEVEFLQATISGHHHVDAALRYLVFPVADEKPRLWLERYLRLFLNPPCGDR